jgi:hypothetical protein
MPWYNDIFDILDDDNDEFEHTAGQLNRYFQVGHINRMYDEEQMVEDDSLSEITSVEVKIFVRRICDTTHVPEIASVWMINRDFAKY